MTHPTKAEWSLYIAHRLPAEKVEWLETHLYSCDDCLATYTACTEEVAGSLPAIRDDADFTESVMEAIRTQKQSGTRQPFYRRTLFHYGVAAAVTLLLMTSGVFQEIVSRVSHVDLERQPSISEHLMDRAGGLLDAFSPTTRRDHHE